MPKSLLRTRRYAFFWGSSLLSNIGTWMQQVAQPWVILALTNSSFWVGMDSFAVNAPSWIFTLWGGILADQGHRKKIILWCQALQFFCVLVLFAFLLLGKLEVWMILLSSFLIGTTDSLSMPAFQAVIPSLVPEEEVPKAIALNSTQFNLSRILGPILAGLLIAKLGATICYAANAVSYLPFFLSLYFIFPKKKESFTDDPYSSSRTRKMAPLPADLTAEALSKTSADGAYHLLILRSPHDILSCIGERDLSRKCVGSRLGNGQLWNRRSYRRNCRWNPRVSAYH